MKLCCDCKWFDGYARCIRNPSLVDGKTPLDHYSSWADLSRKAGWLSSILENTCGKRGRWFEKKPMTVGELSKEAKRIYDRLMKEKI